MSELLRSRTRSTLAVVGKPYRSRAIPGHATHACHLSIKARKEIDYTLRELFFIIAI
jgi:hypothetical protein